MRSYAHAGKGYLLFPRCPKTIHTKLRYAVLRKNLQIMKQKRTDDTMRDYFIFYAYKFGIPLKGTGYLSYLSSVLVWRYCCFFCVRNFVTVKRSDHLSKHNVRKPGWLTMHIGGLSPSSSCMTSSLFKASPHSSISVQHCHSLG